MITFLRNNFTNANSKKNLFLLAFIVLFSLGSVDKASAQISAYVVEQAPYGSGTTVIASGVPASYAFLTAKTILSATSGNVDDAVYNLALPFAYTFNGTTYPAGTIVYVSMNGFMTFGSAPTLTNYTPLSSTETYAGAIAIYGRDMDLIAANTTTINLAYQTTGVAGSRILKIEWVVRRSPVLPGIATEATNLICQLWLYETSNIVEMHYRNYVPATTLSVSGQVGLRGPNNTLFKNLVKTDDTTPWPIVPAVLPQGTANTDGVVTKSTAFIKSTVATIASNGVFRWTPATCFAPSNVLVSSITSTTATVNWTAPSAAPASGYNYYVTTSAIAPTGATAPTGSTAAGVTTAALTGLTSATTYYVYVRSNCGAGDVSAWTSVASFTTYCTPLNIPYFQFFDGPAVSATTPFHAPTIPTCTARQNLGAGNLWVISSAIYKTDSGMDENILMYDGSNPGNANAANVWFFTEGINLVAGATYRMSYLYGGTGTPSTIQNKMLVAYGTAPNGASMTNAIDDHNNVKGSPFENVVNFTATTSGVFFFGMKAYSNANNGQLYLDDIQIVPSNCLRPSAVSVSTIGASSAVLYWTPPTTPPSNGYAYYVSTSSTPPTNDQLPNGTTGPGISSVTLTGLAGSTNYYFWVRSSCGLGEYGEWVALVNGANAYFTTLPASLYCNSTSAASVNYFTNFGTTDAIENVDNPSGFSPSGYGDFTSQIVTQAQGGLVNFDTRVNNLAGGVGIAIWVDWNQDGTFDNSTERVFNTGAYVSVDQSGTFSVPLAAALGVTTMRIRCDYWATSPSPCGAITRGETEDYAFQVVTAPPVLTLSISSDVVCAGSPSDPIVITAGLADYGTFSWSPATGVTGAGTVGSPYIITSNTSQTYTLTAVQNVAPFRFNTTTFRYNANPLPTPITITTPSGATVCQQGPGIPLVATGGIVAGFPIVNQDFNDGTNDWTITSSGTAASAAWTLRPNGYGIALGTVNSNDSSQFYLADSDTGLSSGSTITTNLTSPAFSTVGYSQASLSFWHMYRYFAGDSGKVQISTNGSTWTDLAVYASNTAALNAFQNVIIPLNTYLGQPTVYIRFRYDASWDWAWAIDNVLVSGSASSSVVWTPATGLYTDAATTVAYVAGAGAATVYAMPSANTVYNATASTPAPICSATSSVSVTVTPIVAGTATGTQTICYGAPSNLTLAGNTHAVVKWQYASDALFTVGVTDIAASNLATLTSAAMGSLSATRYYRAVVSNGACIAYSNVITVTLSSTTWNGTAWTNGTPSLTKAAIFAGNFTSAGSIAACSVKVLSGNVTFTGNRTLTVQNTVDVIGGTLTFLNNSSLVQINDVPNSGNITYNRNTTAVIRGDYTYWSSPVTPQTLVALSPLTPSTKYYSFNPATNAWVNINSNNLMDAGKGYIIRAPGTFSATVPAIFNGSFFGTPNNGTLTTPIAGGAGQKNLIGNPYPSALNADLFLSSGLNTSVIDATIYLWTHNTPMANNVYIANDYATYNFMGGIATATAAVATGVNTTPPTGKIASGQGFFIKGLSNGVATFTNAMRVAGNNANFYRTTDEITPDNELERHRYWLDITNTQGAYKQILVGYMQNATNGIDRGFDSEVFEVGNVITMYSTLANKKLSIQGRTLPFDVEDTVPLGYKSTIAGTYTIALTAFDGLFAEGQEVYLEDTVLNVIHDLKAAAYTFATEAGAFDTRFILRYTSDSTLQVGAPSFDANAVVVYKNLEGLHINSGMVNMASVQLHDIQGRLLATRNNIGATETHFTTLSPTQQVVLVTITSQEGVIVTKKVVY